jgi:hypothetical protein
MGIPPGQEAKQYVEISQGDWLAEMLCLALVAPGNCTWGGLDVSSKLLVSAQFFLSL